MKSLDELNAIRDDMLHKMGVRADDHDNIQIVVGMGTCGIASGARSVLTAFHHEIVKHKLLDVTVRQTGCNGICKYEPVVEVITPCGKKTTYVKVTTQRAIRIVSEHIIGKKPVDEYTIEFMDK